MQSKRDIGIMRAEKRGKNEGERDKMLENTEIVKEKTQQTLGAVHTHTHTHTHTHLFLQKNCWTAWRELYFTNLECSLVKCGNKSNLIKIQEGRNTFIGDIKKTDYK